jgi:hypothetical protein
MEFSFGIPSQRGKASAKAVDLCPNMDALTICKNAGPRTAKLMVLNPLACEKLGLEDGGQVAPVEEEVTLDVHNFVDSLPITNGVDTAEEVSDFNNPNY